MKNRTLISAAVAAAMLASTVSSSYASVRYCPPAVGGHSSGSAAPWFVIGCAGGIVLAALAANARDGRELTAEEAWTCGALFLASTPTYKKHKKHRRHHG